MPTKTLPERARWARIRAGFHNEAAAARAIGCSRPTVIRWETEAKSIGDYLLRAAKAYKVRPEWLAMESDDDGHPTEPSGYNTTSRISETLVREPETTRGNYHVDQLDARGDMGDGVVNEDYPEVIRSVDFADSYIRSVMGFLPAPGRLKLVTGVGNSMVPHIRPGESVLIDTGCTDFRGDGIYLINSGSGHQLKALQDRGDAIYVVSANDLYPPFPVKVGTVIGGRAYLLNRIERLS